MGGGIVYEISYTARTWGVDIENLLRKAIESTFIQKNKVKEWQLSTKYNISTCSYCDLWNYFYIKQFFCKIIS